MEITKNKIFHTSWGYNMTLNEYLKVIDETEKSAICVMLKQKIENDDGRGNGRAYPTDEILSKPFRMRKKEYNNKVFLRGSYPFCGDSKRLDSFTEYEGGGNYHNSWD